MTSSSSSRTPALLSPSLSCLKTVGWHGESLGPCEAASRREYQEDFPGRKKKKDNENADSLAAFT